MVADGSSAAQVAGGRQSPPAAPSPEANWQARLGRVQSGLFSDAIPPEAAIAELRQLLAMRPTSAEAHALLGMAYRSSGSDILLGEAKAEFQQALDLDPRFLPARFMLAQIYLDLGRYASAEEEAVAGLAQVPNQAQLLAVQAEAARRLGQPARALTLSQQAIQADPSLAVARYYSALALIDLGRRREAFPILEPLVRSGAAAPEAFVSLGVAYTDEGRLDDAVSVLSTVVQRLPTMVDAHLQLARAYRLKRAFVSAERELTLANPSAQQVQPTPGYDQQQTALALEWGLLRLAQGQFLKAATELERALARDPENGPAHRALAEALIRQRSWDRARAEAAEAARLGAPISSELKQQLDSLPPASSPAPTSAPSTGRATTPTSRGRQ